MAGAQSRKQRFQVNPITATLVARPSSSQVCVLQYACDREPEVAAAVLGLAAAPAFLHPGVVLFDSSYMLHSLLACFLGEVAYAAADAYFLLRIAQILVCVLCCCSRALAGALCEAAFLLRVAVLLRPSDFETNTWVRQHILHLLYQFCLSLFIARLFIASSS